MADKTDGTVSINVGKDLIEPLIKAKVETAILEALGDGQLLMQKAIQQILYTKVDGTGNVSDYSSYNKYTYLESLVRHAVMDSCKDAVKQVVARHQEKFQKEIERQMATAATRSMLVKAFLEGVTNAADRCYNFSMKFDAQGRD